MYYTSHVLQNVVRIARGGHKIAGGLDRGGRKIAGVCNGGGGSLNRGSSLDPKSGTPPPPVNNDHPLK